jgi:hypothetical protein
MMSHQQCAGYSGAVNGFRIILRSSGQQGHRQLRLRAKRRLARSQTDEGGDLFTAHASELASGPQKMSSKTAQRCLDGTPTYKDAFQRFMTEKHK